MIPPAALLVEARRIEALALAILRRKIVTAHIYPPIPIRDFDWCAYFDGEEEAGNYGYGRTETDAINDLMLLNAGGE